MTAYMISIPYIKIDQIRSPSRDTDVVTLAVKVGDQLFPPVTKHLGDVAAGSSPHTVDLYVGPVEVADTDSVVVSFIVANLGYDASDEGLARQFMNTLSDAAAAVCSAVFGAGSAWQVLNKATQWINGLLTADCDGLVAQDQYTFSGSELAELSPQTRPYPGTDSPDGCGANSLYEVTVQATPAAAGTGQDIVATLPTTLALAGYYGPKDNYQHVIAITADGAVNERYFRGRGAPVGADVIRKYPGAVAVAGYYAAHDGYQHVVVAASDGTLHEEWFAGGGGPSGTDKIAVIPGVTHLAGYYSDHDGNQHVIAVASDGLVHEIYYSGGGASPVQNVRGQFADIIGVGAYYCPRDQYGHIIVATSDGTITELYFGGVGPGGQDVLKVIPGVSALCAYYSPGDAHQHVIAGTKGGAVHEIWFTGGADSGQDIRATLTPITSVAAYWSPSDQYEHVIAATDDGALHEIYWTP
jgi:hypothetical protein